MVRTARILLIFVLEEVGVRGSLAEQRATATIVLAHTTMMETTTATAPLCAITRAYSEEGVGMVTGGSTWDGVGAVHHVD